GVVVGTAVLTGALFVGDSLRGSLRDLVLEQLGWVQNGLVTGRFFREELATELGVEVAAPVLLLQGSAVHETKDGTVSRAGKVTILGITPQFAPTDIELVGASDEVVVNTALAKELAVKRGDPITLRFQKAAAVPRETLLGRREAADVLTQLRLKV